MTDLLNKLKQWREITEAATPGEMYHGGPVAKQFTATSRTAMPALLTAVENVLKLHRINQPEDGYCQGYTEIGYGYLDTWCVECSGQSGREYGTEWPCQTVEAIRDALGGTK